MMIKVSERRYSRKTAPTEQGCTLDKPLDHNFITNPTFKFRVTNRATMHVEREQGSGSTHLLTFIFGSEVKCKSFTKRVAWMTVVVMGEQDDFLKIVGMEIAEACEAIIQQCYQKGAHEQKTHIDKPTNLGVGITWNHWRHVEREMEEGSRLNENLQNNRGPQNNGILSSRQWHGRENNIAEANRSGKRE